MSQTSLDHYIECSGGLTSWFLLAHGLVWIWIVRNPLILDLTYSPKADFYEQHQSVRGPQPPTCALGRLTNVPDWTKKRRGKTTTFEQSKSTPSTASIGRCLRWFHASGSSEIPLFVFAHQREFAHVPSIPPLFVASAILFGLCCKLYCLCAMNNGENWVSFLFLFIYFFARACSLQEWWANTSRK